MKNIEGVIDIEYCEYKVYTLCLFIKIYKIGIDSLNNICIVMILKEGKNE